MDIIVFYISTIFYLISGLVFFYYWIRNKKSQKRIRVEEIFLLIGWFIHIGSILLRFKNYGYFPVTSLYETIVFISFGIIPIFLILKYKFRIKNLEGMFISAIIILNFVALFLNKNPNLTPDLQTVWLVIHVPIGLLSYGCFTASFILSLIYVINYYIKDKPNKTKMKKCYQIMFKLISFGVILLFFCIVSGAIWAKYAWGSFWGWDPKETWSLITLLSYLIFILACSFNKKKPILNVFISIASFMCVIFTYLGVSLLMTGLHSYI